MLLLRIVFAIGCLVVVNGENPSSEASCGLFYCPYSCDLMLRYLKLYLKKTEVNTLTFLNLTPFEGGGQRSDINEHSSVCMCDGFLTQRHLSNEDLETFEFTKGTEANQKCFILTHGESTDDEEEEETGDGIFVILLLVVVAFLLWIIAVVSVTWYAHCKRVSRQTFSDENQNLMSRESFAIHSTGVATVGDRRTNPANVSTVPETPEDQSVRDVAVITLYSSLPSMPGTRRAT